ncbi:phage baseplate assembly protein V [Piscinibacter sakaiensis]|uniref:phage baseplate assembly protein V n=1 Tax=Piscinibacter sakaiensis TaxID=1547922 RepID=UPI003AB00A4A
MDRADPQTLLPTGTPPALGPAWAGGVFLARVADIVDPEGLARVQVRLHGASGVDDQDMPLWAQLVSAGAGDNRGSYWVPDVDDLVVVAFVQGDARFPIVLGGLWNGSATPPEAMDGSGNNNLKVLRSRNGVKVTLDDEDGQEKLILETPGGQTLTLRDGPGSCELVDSNGNSITLESAGVTITAAAKVKVEAATVEVSAGMVTVNAGMSKFSGVVQCDTLISNSVVSASYTPGAGNIW